MSNSFQDSKTETVIIYFGPLKFNSATLQEHRGKREANENSTPEITRKITRKPKPGPV